MLTSLFTDNNMQHDRLFLLKSESFMLLASFLHFRFSLLSLMHYCMFMRMRLCEGLDVGVCVKVGTYLRKSHCCAC